MDADTLPPLTDKQRAIIGKLARRYAGNKALQSVLSSEDYFQAGYLEVWRFACGLDRPVSEAEVHVVSRRAMSMERRRLSGDKDRQAQVLQDPLRCDLAQPASGEALDALEALEVLDDEEKTIAVKRYWEGKSHRDISDETGVSIHRVDRIGGIATKKLKTRLEPAYAEEYSRKHRKKYGWRIYGSYHAGRRPRTD